MVPKVNYFYIGGGISSEYPNFSPDGWLILYVQTLRQTIGDITPWMNNHNEPSLIPCPALSP